MAAATRNLTVYQGSDFREVYIIRSENSTPIDLTGYSFSGQAKIKYTDSSPSFTLSIIPRDQVSYPGYVDFHIPNSETSPLSITKATNYLYDIEMTDDTGEVKRIIQGTIQLHPEVTK